MHSYLPFIFALLKLILYFDFVNKIDETNCPNEKLFLKRCFKILQNNYLKFFER